MHQDLTVKSATIALLAALVTCACLPQAARSSPEPSPTTAPTVPPRTATPTATATAARTVSPTPRPATPATAAPGTTCQRSTGGSATGGGALAEVRVGSQQGFERVVFDFGAGGLPEYTIEQAASFVATSGQAVPVQGNTHVSIRFNGAGAMGSYRGPTSLRPGSTLIHEVKLVEDFEGVLVWGVGLERVSCPRVLVLGSPTRLVVDFPN